MPSIENLEQACSIRSLGAAAIGLTLLCAPACNTSNSPHGGTNTPGAVIDHPDASPLTSKRFVVDPNDGGKASALGIAGLFWGRMVDVYDRADDGTRELQHKEYVVGANIVSDGHDYLLETNPVTGVEELTILHPFGGDDGVPSSDDAYQAAFAHLDTDLLPVQDAPIDAVGVFTMLPRNAALVIVFDDLLDPGLVNGQTIRVLTGSPPVLPFTPRVLVDTNHGDVVPGPNGTMRFFSTRVIVDPTVSEIEAFQFNPPLALNGAGLPASTNASLANVVVRIPTVEKPALGQEIVLRNPSGHKVASNGNGTVDFGSPTVDVVRAMRSGGDALVTGDPFNGYLRDETPPEILSVQPIAVLVPPQPDPDGTEVDFILPQIQFLTLDCARDPQVGDVIRQTTNFAQVREITAPLSGAIAEDVKVRLLVGDPTQFVNSGVGAAQYMAPYIKAIDEVRPHCFVRVSPDSEQFPDQPHVDISTGSVFSVRFSEAMSKTSVRAFDSMLLTREAAPDSGGDYVVSSIQPSVDLKEYTLLPELPLAHVSGNSESYFLELTTGPLGPTDLAGNELADPLPQVTFTIGATLASQGNDGHVTRFRSFDEEPPIGNDLDGELPEWIGQHTYDLERQSIRPRSVVRFEAVADRSKPMVQAMNPVTAGIREPLIKFGAKVQSLWRNCDVDLPLVDTTTYNVDVEGLSWVPLGGLAVADHFEEFEMRLAHSLFLPDEYILPGPPPLQAYPNSGVVKLFESNLVAPGVDPLKVVHRRELGYTISPGDIFASETGTLVLPYPLNRTVPPSQFTYYTWRDTALTARGAPEGGGAEVTNYRNGGANAQPLMSATLVESVGLPLLMEIRCFPSDKAFGTNLYDVALAPILVPGTLPVFRAFSAGGIDANGAIIERDPDLEEQANGGFNPLSTPPGQPTNGVDEIVYLGMIDLVTRVSRSYSVWIPAEGTSNPVYQPPLIEPGFDEQPPGTAIEVAFRGATSADPDTVRQDASALDFYGDFYVSPGTNRDSPNTQINFLNGDAEWHSDVSEIDGAPFFQVRLTFLANPETGIGPEISGLGVTWSH